MSSFQTAKQKFDSKYRNQRTINSIVPVHGKSKKNIPILNKKGERLEEFFKWEFIYALTQSGLYAKDHIGTEVFFPKGSKGSKPLKIDGAIFDDQRWLKRYNDFWKDRRPEDLQWLGEHLVAVIEFKREEKPVGEVFLQQVKPAMREKDPSDAYILGMYYDKERLYLFHRRDGSYLRYDESKNRKGIDSKIGDLSLELPDPYHFIPSFKELLNIVNRPAVIDRSKRTIHDLEVITSISSVQTTDALSNVLRTLDKAGLTNQRGYEILIQTLALKVFDEKRNQTYPNRHLQFYITGKESDFTSLGESPIQGFIERMKSIRGEALKQYTTILEKDVTDWKETDHVRAVASVCKNFQDYSFVRSSKSDLYQLVFYNFANQFQQQEKAQFLTPLPIINFLVNIVNPRNAEYVLDPCCGIGDFLSLSYINAQSKEDQWKLDDENIYGADLSADMIALASLNMLLNGDGRAHLFHVRDKGSIVEKVKRSSPPVVVKLMPKVHKKGNWDEWPDKTELLKFDVILTNPPFGSDRSYNADGVNARDVIGMYEIWHLLNQPKKLDLGVVFLENAYRCLKTNGRLGIVLSNSIASITRWEGVRKWLMERMRIVALFDLPPNVFAETGVNTTLIVAYKPAPEELERLIEQGYSVFVRDIKNVGYEKRTVRRNVVFKKVYRIDETTFEVEIDSDGNPLLDEDFTQAQIDFRDWARGQEKKLVEIFLEEEV